MWTTEATQEEGEYALRNKKTETIYPKALMRAGETPCPGFERWSDPGPLPDGQVSTLEKYAETQDFEDESEAAMTAGHDMTPEVSDEPEEGDEAE